MSSKYRNFDAGWFQQLPEHWRALKLRRLCQVKRGASPRPIDDPIYFDEAGSHGWVRISDVTASDRILTVTEQRLSEIGKSLSVKVQPGELFLSIAGSVGKPIIAGIPCCIHDGFVYFDRLEANPEFLYYVFVTGRPYAGLGKLGTQLNLNTDTVSDIYVPLPTEDQQKAIVRFLDTETSKLDDLIAKKLRLIELLDEKRAALISRAVTQGLDPSVPMKDTRFSWLPRVPSNWELLPLKRRWRIVDCKHRTATYCDEGIPIVSTTEVKPGLLDLSIARKTSTEEYEDLTSSGRRPRSGDIIYSRNASLGSAAYVDTNEPFCMGQDVCLITSQDEDQLYLMYQLNSSFAQAQLESAAVGSTFLRINISQIACLNVCCPPRDEQKRISAHVKIYTKSIQGITRKIEANIDLLREYRSALITAAVTGQLDIPAHEKKLEALA